MHYYVLYVYSIKQRNQSIALPTLGLIYIILGIKVLCSPTFLYNLDRWHLYSTWAVLGVLYLWNTEETHQIIQTKRPIRSILLKDGGDCNEINAVQ